MRFLLLSLTALTLLFPAAAIAQQTDTATLGRGSIPDPTVISLPPATKAEIEEAAAIYETCNSGNDQSYFDCDCTSLGFLQMRVTERAQGLPKADTYSLMADARLSCPNKAGLAGRTYTICMSWAPKMYPNYEEFCTCYANSYAENFAKNPTDSLTVNEHIMSASLRMCNAGSAAIAKIEREKKIRQMKKMGVYDQLFPSAKESGLATTLPERDRALSTAPPSQRLSDQLLAPDTDPRIPER